MLRNNPYIYYKNAPKKKQTKGASARRGIRAGTRLTVHRALPLRNFITKLCTKGSTIIISRCVLRRDFSGEHATTTLLVR